MKRLLSLSRKALALTGVLVLLLAAFLYAALRSGPLASIPITLMTVENQAIAPGLHGIGTVEARYTHKIGPTFAGRLTSVLVQPGDHVIAGQLLGEMDPVDLDERLAAQDASLRRAEASIMAVRAQLQEAAVRASFAETQFKRYRQLAATQVVSAEAADGKRQEFSAAATGRSAAQANLDVSRQELSRLRAEREGLLRQRSNLRLVSPSAGLVSRRDADPGTTVIAGQSVVEVVEPGSLWINVRFDQLRAPGLRAGLPAQIVLRSQSGAPLAGEVARVEAHADPVTEELLAKVDFKPSPRTPPPIGELAEVSVALARHAPMPVVPNASVQRVDGQLGVWVVEDGSLRFAPVRIGATDLEGRVQILKGLDIGQRVVVYSRKALARNSRIQVVDSLVDKSP